jgi:hypothetical protein
MGAAAWPVLLSGCTIALDPDAIETQRAQSVTENLLSRLSGWYASHCNGEWEHQKGISIRTTDNPGWWVKIDIAKTNLAGRPFATISQGTDAEGFPEAANWLCCQLQDSQWHGAGDATRLNDILGRFLAWADIK